MDKQVNCKVSSKVKYMIDKSGYNAREILEYGLDNLVTEEDKLKANKFFLKKELEQLKLDEISVEIQLEDINKKLIELNPEDDEDLNEILDEEIHSMVVKLINNHSEKAYNRVLDNKIAISSLKSIAKEKHLPVNDFVEGVISELKSYTDGYNLGEAL